MKILSLDLGQSKTAVCMLRTHDNRATHLTRPTTRQAMHDLLLDRRANDLFGQRLMRKPLLRGDQTSLILLFHLCALSVLSVVECLLAFAPDQRLTYSRRP